MNTIKQVFKKMLKTTFLCGLIFGLSACGKKGKVTLKLENSPETIFQAASSDIAGFVPVVPTEFQMKILTAYLVEDVVGEQGDNDGHVVRIWDNVVCAGKDSCSHEDAEWFDLVDPAQANETLNSQSIEFQIKPDIKYNYLKLDFCIGEHGGIPNVRFKVPDNDEWQEKTYSGCGVTSVKFETPLQLTAENSVVAIQLSYDLNAGTVYYSTAEGSSCTSVAPCLGGIDIVPSLVE